MSDPTELDPAVQPDTGRVAVVGGGPAGMTAALLLAEAGRSVTLFEAADGLGGLWASELDGDGRYKSDNSCKVFQPSYTTAPALLERIGTTAEAQFVERYDLTSDWLKPFVADSNWRDLARLASAFALKVSGLKPRHDVSVEEYLNDSGVSDACQRWMRATALGGIAGTLRMTVWELGHRLASNLDAVLVDTRGPLHWNARPPNCEGGFVRLWASRLAALGVDIRLASPVEALTPLHGGGVAVATQDGVQHFQSALLALPPPALARLVLASDPRLARAFGQSPAGLAATLHASKYEHLGITWHFDKAFERDLPLGGNSVRDGWHPILVQHDQYGHHLPEGVVTTVVGSVAVDTVLRHPRLGTMASEHSFEELAQILWEDEQRLDPSLPEPCGFHVHGLSAATQITGVGPFPLRGEGVDVYLATNLHGLAPYFTASLEAAIQAGCIAAAAVEPEVQPLPMPAAPSLPWKAHIPRRSLELSTEIPCSAERARALLLDTGGWSRWSRFVVGIEGALVPGARWDVDVRSKGETGSTRLRPRLLSTDPEDGLRFATTVGSDRLLRMEHGFQFEATGPNRCVLRQPFSVSGALAVPLWSRLRPTLEEFEAVGDDLAAFVLSSVGEPAH
jgi:monoamine oxidase